MELQTLGDRMLKKLSYSHVVRFIQQMNKKHKDEAKNKPLQNVLFQMLQVYFLLHSKLNDFFLIYNCIWIYSCILTAGGGVNCKEVSCYAL